MERWRLTLIESGYFPQIRWFSSLFSLYSPISQSLNAYRSSASSVMTSRSSSGSSHAVGIAFTPCIAPSRLPAIAPVESESPSWFTARITPCLKLRATSAQ